MLVTTVVAVVRLSPLLLLLLLLLLFLLLLWIFGRDRGRALTSFRKNNWLAGRGTILSPPWWQCELGASIVIFLVVSIILAAIVLDLLRDAKPGRSILIAQRRVRIKTTMNDALCSKIVCGWCERSYAGATL
jgi:hypothetical protein